MNVVNLTPHAITVRVGQDQVTFKPSGAVARVSTNQTPVGNVNGIPVVKQVFGEIQNLPQPTGDTIYIVSQIVLSAAQAMGRTDCMAPNTSNAIRNDDGQIVAVPGLIV